jgi:hypothetical protein
LAFLGRGFKGLPGANLILCWVDGGFESEKGTSENRLVPFPVFFVGATLQKYFMPI